MEAGIKEKSNIIPGEYRFPDGFLWGTSTSAYQTEGGIKNDWSVWERSAPRLRQLMKQKKNSYDYICAGGCDSYRRYEEDLDLAASLSTNAIRFGLEWARIQPEKDTWDIEAINHYREVLRAAKKRGLKTVVTLWHWTNPVWIADAGGWEKKETVEAFIRYVDLVIRELGADIDYWVTLNEPMVHVVNGYLNKKFPPNKRSLLKSRKVFLNLAEAHRRAYGLIHRHFPGAQVSVTMLAYDFEPARGWCPGESMLAKVFDYFGNAMFTNRIKKQIDYIGLDYYFHGRVVWYPPFVRNRNESTSDLGWEIYPKGIYHILKRFARYGKPLLILENGLADADDSRRSDFIRDHLYWVHRAISDGVDVRGYFYWSLLDNFEWALGWGPKFGLHAVDRDTFTRTARPSADVYAEICKENALQLKIKN